MDIGDLGFSQTIVDDYLIREFDYPIPEYKLYWHKDKRDRIVSVICGINWKLQMDNCLPIELLLSNEYFIPKETYHRLIIGDSKLVLKIKEL